MQQELETLKKWIDNSDNIVFFGGGVWTVSITSSMIIRRRRS